MTVPQIILDAIESEVLTGIQTDISHIAVGSGTTTPAEGDTSLVTETDIDALFDEYIQLNTYVAEIFLDVNENNGNDINEMGSFDAVSGGTMFSRNLTNLIPKDNTTEVIIELDIILTTINI